MKKVFISLLGLILSIGAWAQCPTEGTEAYPVPVDSSLLTINGARRADCDAYIKGSYIRSSNASVSLKRRPVFSVLSPE